MYYINIIYNITSSKSNPALRIKMSDDDEEDDYYSGKLACSSCGETDMMRNVEDDEEEDMSSFSDEQKHERFVHDDVTAMCLSCGHEMESTEFPWRVKFNHYKVGVVQSVTVFKKTYQNLEIDVGDAEPLKVVTNGKVSEGQRVVVACVGAIVPAGAAPDDEGIIVVKRGSIQGKPSHGMLCDSPSLGWHGPRGVAAPISDVWDIGSCPPESKQRQDIAKKE